MFISFLSLSLSCRFFSSWFGSHKIYTTACAVYMYIYIYIYVNIRLHIYERICSYQHWKLTTSNVQRVAFAFDGFRKSRWAVYHNQQEVYSFNIYKETKATGIKELPCRRLRQYSPLNIKSVGLIVMGSLPANDKSTGNYGKCSCQT